MCRWFIPQCVESVCTRETLLWQSRALAQGHLLTLSFMESEKVGVKEDKRLKRSACARAEVVKGARLDSGRLWPCPCLLSYANAFRMAASLNAFTFF